MNQDDIFKKLTSHCKEYGFIFQSSDIYDGLSAVYDYGQNGVELKNNIRKYWWDSMLLMHDNIVGLDSAILCIRMSGKPPAMLMLLMIR
jgi:glycyl-tRNA synthetase